MSPAGSWQDSLLARIAGWHRLSVVLLAGSAALLGITILIAPRVLAWFVGLGLILSALVLAVAAAIGPGAER